jgi:uncharacterized membrane protein YccC
MPSLETTGHLKHAAKTGLAAVLAFYLARFLGLPESYWAAISAIIVMYSRVRRIKKRKSAPGPFRHKIGFLS